jgi:Domain of unknown function (DUF4276)
MKLGLVLECDVGGPDERVLTCFARRLVPGIKVESVALGDKPTIFSKGVETAQRLVETNGCDLVLIVWDLKPFLQGPPPATHCLHEAEVLRQRLAALKPATRAKIRLLCLTWELETWFIADEKAVSAHLSTEAHKTKFKCSKPGQKTAPKAVLDKACKDARGRSHGYEDFKEAIRIACEVEQTNKLQAIPSFERFAELLTGNSAAPFLQTGEVCKDLRHGATMMGQPGATSPAPLTTLPAPASTKNKAKPRRKVSK